MNVEELDRLCEEAIKLKAIYEEKDEAKKAAHKEFKAVEGKIINILEEHGKQENEGSFGKVKILATEYFKMSDKDEAMQWLKETGDFDALASVNAKTFSSHVKALVHEKRDSEGDFAWMPPGVEDATSQYKKLRIT